MLITKEIEITLDGNILHYRKLGYTIPTHLDNRGRIVSKGEKLKVKVEDIRKNSKRKIEVKCDYCKENYMTTLEIYHNGHSKIKKDACSQCKHKKIKDVYLFQYGTTSIKVRSEIQGFKMGRNKTDGQIVFDLFISRGYEPQFKPNDYINSHTKLPYICPKHIERGILYITYDSLKISEQGCVYCACERRNATKRYSYDFVKSKFEDKNYTLLSKIYKNCDEYLEFICNEHSDDGIQTTTLWKVLNSNCNCKTCRYKQTSEENHWNWKGGIGLERDKIKQTQEYKDWRTFIFQKDNYTSQCCGIKGAEINAHHLYNFSEYPDLRMDISNGITLCEYCHSIGNKGSFHNIYTQFNNTPEQLQQYIEDYKLGKYDELRLSNKTL